MALVIDTDVISFLYKRDTRAALYSQHLSGHLQIISFMTLAELERWTLAANWGLSKRQHFGNYLRRFVVHPSSAALCRKWAEVVDERQRMGRPIATSDAWIAATALLLNLPVVTHNRGDFAHISGLQVISEGPI